MKTVFYLFLIFGMPLFAFSQSDLYSNPTSHKKIETDCHDMIFTRVEKMPSLKVSEQVFEDTLCSILKSKGIPIKNQSITYKFVVTSQSEFLGIEVLSGEVRKQKVLRETILSLSNLWLPAQQNSRLVCAYIKLQIDFVDGKAKISISQ